jgi:hypothetical protein
VEKNEKELEAEGWQLTATTSGQHLQRTLEMCAELGFEVHTEEVTPEECGGCTICFIEGNEKIIRVYTRAKGPADDTV